MAARVLNDAKVPRLSCLPGTQDEAASAVDSCRTDLSADSNGLDPSPGSQASPRDPIAPDLFLAFGHMVTVSVVMDSIQPGQDIDNNLKR